MKPIVAVVAQGSMGSAVAARLVENGIEVRTSLTGRSEASASRAVAAGMRPVSEAELVEADILLSIVPPGEAVPLAERLVPFIKASDKKLVYADCNAVSPQTAIRIGKIIGEAGLRFVDAGIIGGPPKPDARGPIFYASGPDARDLMILTDYGLAVKPLDGAVGAASGLKMSYGGITKGTTAIAAAMILAATRFGAAEDLKQELAESQPNVLAALTRSLPDMYPKAYRWVAEMEEIADFAGDDAAARQIYQAIAQLYQRFADDLGGEKIEIGEMTAFLKA